MGFDIIAVDIDGHVETIFTGCPHPVANELHTFTPRNGASVSRSSENRPWRYRQGSRRQ